MTPHYSRYGRFFLHVIGRINQMLSMLVTAVTAVTAVRTYCRYGRSVFRFPAVSYVKRSLCLWRDRWLFAGFLLMLPLVLQLVLPFGSPASVMVC